MASTAGYGIGRTIANFALPLTADTLTTATRSASANVMAMAARFG